MAVDEHREQQTDSSLPRACPTPQSMKAVVAMRYGGRDVMRMVRDAPLPVAQQGELLIRNAFASVNFHDTCTYDRGPSRTD